MNDKEVILQRIYEIEDMIIRVKEVLDTTNNSSIYRRAATQLRDLEALKDLSNAIYYNTGTLQ